MAGLVLGAVGAAIGGSVITGTVLGLTGASIGWLIGSTIGNLLSQKSPSVGAPPREDLRIIGSQYGTPIPYHIGRNRYAGNIIAASAIRPTTTTTRVGGNLFSRGARVSTTTYDVDLWILFARNRCDNWLRIFYNGELVASQRVDADLGTTAAEADFCREITWLDGNDDQLPDPDYETIVGVGNAQAWRGYSILKIRGLQLGTAGQVGNISAEIVRTQAQEQQKQEVAAIPLPDGSSLRRVFGISTLDPAGFYLHVAQWQIAGFDTQRVQRWYIDGTGAARVSGEYSIIPTNNHPSADGASDVDCLVVYTRGANARLYVHVGAGAVDRLLDTSSTTLALANSVVRVCYYQGVLFAANVDPLATGGRGTIYRWGPGDGAPITQSPPFGEGAPYWMASDGVNLYCCRTATGTVRVYNATNLSFIEEWSAPTSSPAVVIVGDDSLVYLNQRPDSSTSFLYRRVGSAWVQITTNMNPGTGVVNTDAEMWAFRRDTLLAIDRGGLTDPNHRYAAVRLRYSAANEPLGDVVAEICEQWGYPPSRLSMAALNGQSVDGLTISNITTARQLLDALASVYLFDVRKAQQLQGVPRGQAPVATIPFADLGAHSAGAQVPERLPITLDSDVEVPAGVTVTYANPDFDYQVSSARSFRISTGSRRERVVDLGTMILTPQQAKRLADVWAMDAAMARYTVGPIVLTDKWAALNPPDVVVIEGPQGESYRVRLLRRVIKDGLYEFNGVLEEPSIATSVALTDESYTSQTQVVPSSPWALAMLDVPAVRDGDYDTGIYWVGAPLGQASSGATLFDSGNGQDYQPQLDVTQAGVIGVTQGILAAWSGGPNTLDPRSVVRVSLPGATLASITREQLFADDTAHYAAIGNTGRWEIVKWQTATLISAGVYDISNMLRGQRGTEPQISGHLAGDLFIPLTPEALRRLPLDIGQINLSRFYRLVTFGRDLDTADTVQAQSTGAALRPLTPVWPRKTIDHATDDLVLEVQRRTRLIVPGWPVTQVPPQGEVTLRWRWEIYSSGFAALLRTVDTTEPTLRYTSAQQVADFGANQTSVSVRVCQLSDLVGRGYTLQRVF